MAYRKQFGGRCLSVYYFNEIETAVSIDLARRPDWPARNYLRQLASSKTAVIQERLRLYVSTPYPPELGGIIIVKAGVKNA